MPISLKIEIQKVHEIHSDGPTAISKSTKIHKLHEKKAAGYVARGLGLIVLLLI